MLNRWRKQAINNFFLLVHCAVKTVFYLLSAIFFELSITRTPVNSNFFWNPYSRLPLTRTFNILNTWITINFSSNTTQREIIQCNVLYRGKYIMKNFISLDVPFLRFPRLNDYASWNKLQVRKRTFTQTFFLYASCLGRVLLNRP